MLNDFDGCIWCALRVHLGCVKGAFRWRLRCIEGAFRVHLGGIGDQSVTLFSPVILSHSDCITRSYFTCSTGTSYI